MTKKYKELMSWEVKTSLCNSVDLGIKSICEKLKVDLKTGLTGEDFLLRTEFFGNNFRPPLKAKTWISLFLGALDDFMLKVLIFSAIVSITFDLLLSKPEDRSHGKCLETYIKCV
jgi:hypothetical protein